MCLGGGGGGVLGDKPAAFLLSCGPLVASYANASLSLTVAGNWKEPEEVSKADKARG